MKKIFICLVLVIICLFIDIYDSSENTIVVYSAMEHFRNDSLKEHLEERFPDYDIQLMYLPTAKVAAKVKSEKTYTDADIIVGVETGYLEMITDSLGDAVSRSTLEYLPGLNPEHGKYVIWENSGVCIALNTKILEKYNLPEPKTYEDLLDPMYKNLIAFQDPKSSSTGFNVYLALRNEMGLDKALEYFDALNENIKQYTESGSGVAKMLIQGEVAIGPSLTLNAVAELNNGHPLKIIFPPEGSPNNLGGTAFIKGREKDEKVMEVFDYIINEYLKIDNAYFNPGQILVDHQVKLENYPTEVTYADMTDAENIEVKNEMLRRWKF